MVPVSPVVAIAAAFLETFGPTPAAPAQTLSSCLRPAGGAGRKQLGRAEVLLTDDIKIRIPLPGLQRSE